MHQEMKIVDDIKNTIRPIYNKIFRYYVGDVIVLHRVVENHEANAQKNQALEITVNELQKLINQYRYNGYAFVSLDDFVEEKKKFFGKRKLVTITLDDGYKDNYTIALPLFKKESVPFTVFISVDIVEHTAALWWYVLEDILWSNIRITLDGHIYSLKTNEDKNIAFDTIHAQLSKLDTKETINWFKRNHVDWDTINAKYCQDICMTWEELEQLGSDSLCTIGSHTMTHARLPKQSEPIRKNELSQSKEILEKRLKCKIQHITYPYGASSDEVVRDVIKTGYISGFLSNGGSVRKDQNIYRMTRTKWNQ